MISPEPLLVQVDQKDKDQIERLLHKESFVHRHKGWQPALDWLGKQPYLALRSENRIVSVLACPPDEDNISWLRLFAVEPGFSIFRSWNVLWPPALDWLRVNSSVETVNSLVVKNKLSGLLKKTGFIEGYRVVVLLWDIVNAIWPDNKGDSIVRPMEFNDLEHVYYLDQQAFGSIWRNSLEHLKIALSESFSATVVEIDHQIVGYQISTLSSQVGHLARLAVEPGIQNRGVGTALVWDLLDRFQRRGIVQVTVNTQKNNQPSLEVYQKFGFKMMEDEYPVYQYQIS